MDQPFMGLNTRSLLTAGLIAGIAIGLLSNIPVIACVNCLLLAWVWGGAIGAVYLYRQRENQPPLTMTQGLVIGVVAGVIGAIIGGIASLLLGGLTAAAMTAMETTLGTNNVDIPSFLVSTGFNIIGVILSIVIYAIVGAIGGLIATGLIWKTPSAPMAPPPYNPPPSGPTI
jgi:hypothetical protein